MSTPKMRGEYFKFEVGINIMTFAKVTNFPLDPRDVDDLDQHFYVLVR
jgi:hypothetical protein